MEVLCLEVLTAFGSRTVPGGDHVLRGHSDDGVVRRLDQQRGQQQGIGGPHLPRGGAFDSLGDFGSQDWAAQGFSPEIVYRVPGVAMRAPKSLPSNPMIKVYRANGPASPSDGMVLEPSIRWGSGPL